MNGQGPEPTRRLTPDHPRWWFAGWRPVTIRHPAVLVVCELVPEWARTTVVSCPRCPVDGNVVTVLHHLVGDHDSGLPAAAEWLETVDGDLFALVVHDLMCRAGVAQPATTS